MRVTPANRPYRPRGGVLEGFYSKAPEVLLSGPARTGKSRGNLEFVHYCCERWKNVRVLIARKVRADLAESVLQTFEDEVLPEGHPIMDGADRSHRSHYQYPNGSRIVLGGFNKVQRILSTEYDLVYIPETVECTQADLEVVISRLSGQALPFKQLRMDTNPSHPEHHLKKRCDAGIAELIECGPDCNPRFWDHVRGRFSPDGEAYYRGLEARLTGQRLMSLRYGKWAIAEGARFKNLDESLPYPSGQLFDADVLWERGVEPDWVKWISIDHGVAAPYCALWHAAPSDREIFTVREDYQTGFEADEQALRVVQLSPENEVYAFVSLDPSMWQQDKRGRAALAGEKKAADYYIETLAAENDRLGYAKFGPVLRGPKMTKTGLGTLAVLMNRGNQFPNWYIERGCKNLWGELLGAVYYKVPGLEIWTEELDPRCADHAMTAAYYGLHRYIAGPDDPEGDELDPEALRQRQEQDRYERSLKSFLKRSKRR